MLKFFQVITYPPKSLQWIWKWHYCDIWISSNVLSSINLNVSGTHPADAPIATIIIYNNYTKQSKTHLSAHDGLRWKSGTRKKQIINKLLAEGSDLLYLWRFARDINWKSLYQERYKNCTCMSFNCLSKSYIGWCRCIRLQEVAILPPLAFFLVQFPGPSW